MKLNNGTGVNANIKGHLGNAPELRKDQFGHDSLYIGVAIDQVRRENDQFVNKSEWININVRGDLAVEFSRYAKKGMYLEIEAYAKCKKVDVLDDLSNARSVTACDFEATAINLLKDVSADQALHDKKVG